MHYIKQFHPFFEESPFLSTLIVLVLLLTIAWIANFIVKKSLLILINRVLRFTPYSDDKDFMHNGVTSRLANIVPALIVIVGIELFPDIPDVLAHVIRNVASSFIVLTIALALSAIINFINALYMQRPDASNKPIKGYLQVLKLAIYLVGTVLIIAILVDKSPVILLSGLGAMAAVLMLVFQDTLLSLVASVQISSSDMVRVGDWIEMPQLNADGDVIDIALHTVKVQNWDKTITTLPIRRLISDPFKNWRGMQEAGGRRIKRSLYLDQNSIHFLNDEQKQRLHKISLLKEYLDTKEEELKAWNQHLDEDNSDLVNMRRLTNIGTFRAYINQYLRYDEDIHQGMTLVVRQLNPGPDGLPLEIYCFTRTTAWGAYENIQSDIFDHLYAILPEFGLRAFQQPSGHDFQVLMKTDNA